MDRVVSTIESVPALPAYLIIALLVFGEAAFFLGFVLPGETAVLLGGFLASTHHLDLWLLCVIVVLSAILGDTVGYEVGRHVGPRVLRVRLLAGHLHRLEQAQGMLRKRGGPAVFVGRFTAFFRAVMPGLAGLSAMPYRTFLAWNALGGICWGVGFSLVGYFAGASYQRVASTIGKGSAVVIALLVIVAFVVWHVRKRRRERDEEAHGPHAAVAVADAEIGGDAASTWDTEHHGDADR